MPKRPASPSRLLRPALGAVLLLLFAAGAAAEDADPPAPAADAVADGEKFGLSEAQRKDVFIALADAEDRAEREAAQQFEGNPESEGQVALTDQLLNRYRAEIARAHGLSEAQLVEIQAEGFRREWPLVLQ